MTKSFFLLLFASVLTTGCMKELPAPHGYFVDSRFESYIEAFKQSATENGIELEITNLSVEFESTLEPDVYGKCYPMDQGRKGVPAVYINAQRWMALSEIERKALLYHELGHCVLWLAHNSQMITYRGSDIPESLMYPILGDESLYIGDWLYYVGELFQKEYLKKMISNRASLVKAKQSVLESILN